MHKEARYLDVVIEGHLDEYVVLTVDKGGIKAKDYVDTVTFYRDYKFKEGKPFYPGFELVDYDPVIKKKPRRVALSIVEDYE